MATDLATMKARIVKEMGDRADLTQPIADAIDQAIKIYQLDRFWFNEKRDISFPTVVGQEFYSVADSSFIPDLLEIDWVMKIVNSQVIELDYIRPKRAEDYSNNATITGEPTSYSYYDRKIRLFPVPNSVLTIRIAAHYKLAAPTNDTDTTNDWIIEAERLIRARAKYILATEVALDPDLAAANSPDKDSDPPGAAYVAFCDLKGRTNLQTSTGYIEPSD